ncbi:MAG: YihY/virulence factor BrkB family protein [Bacteroidetes bacterium]|nr:YihY/virulence factor BrkB family protein [Bacteroidota bacterium]
MKFIIKHLRAFWNSFKNSFLLFRKHDTLTLGAALSYYTGFSLIPIIVLVISIAGSVLGPLIVQEEIKTQLGSFLGVNSAKELEGIIKVVYLPEKNLAVAVIAAVLLLIGATSVFSQLHTSLNLIWDVKNKARQPIMSFFVHRLFSFAMIVCLSFLLLVSFMIHTGLGIFSNYLDSHLPQTSVFILHSSEFLISYGFTSLLFALLFKYMSDAKPRWGSIWPGALFTAFLFMIGKYVLGIYIARFNVDDSYGAAGAIVLLLTWVFYSSQIIFFGAEFTHALAAEHGTLLDTNAIDPKADEGMKHTHVLEGKG